MPRLPGERFPTIAPCITADGEHFMTSRIVIALFLAISSIGAEAASTTLTAWDQIQKSHPSLSSSVTTFERLVLQRLSPEEFAKYQQGVPASEIVLLSGESLQHFLDRNKGGALDLQWWSISGGGGTSSAGGGFTLSGTIGQHEASTSSGGVFLITGGFWAVETDASKLFCDGFETGNTNQWNSVFGG